MPKINEYININKKPVEIVHEVKGDEYKVPSFEDFVKSYESDSKVDYSDLESGGIGANKSYGPGNNMSNEEGKRVVKGTTGIATGVGIAALSIVCPPAGAAALASSAICLGTAKTVSHFAPEDSTTKEIADFAGDICEISTTIGAGPEGVKHARDKINKK